MYEIPSQNVAYRISVLVSEITKTEVKENGYMTCGLTLTPLSFWEDNEKNSLVISVEDSRYGKKYPLTRPYRYAGSNALDNVAIDITGNMEVPFEITIDGGCTDPSYQIYASDETTVRGQCQFSGTYSYVYVNSDEAEEEIKLFDGNGTQVTYPYNYQILSSVEENTFLTLKKGRNKLRFSLGSLFEGTVTIEWRNRYVSI